MTDIVISHPVKELSVTARARQFVVRLAEAFERAIVAGRVQRELNALPDLMLRDIGLNRCDIRFVADALASGKSDLTRPAVDRINRSTARRRLLQSSGRTSGASGHVSHAVLGGGGVVPVVRQP